MIVFSSGLAIAQNNDRTYTNSIGMKFVLIPAGTFMMGGDKNIEDALDNELPQHEVKIGKPFYLGVYEVTQRQWKAVMDDNLSIFNGEDNSVEMVRWEDVQIFIERLNQKEGHSRYRLPTEAEWEYAARAGSTSAYYFGNDVSQLGDFAWYKDNSDKCTHPVGQKPPNAWGLYDTLGNVWEFLGDWYGENYYADSPPEDPTGPSSGASRAIRGCGWNDDARNCRSALRGWIEPAGRGDNLGFRLALSPESGE
jgi:formylglycine-generating enzyme required for sulfatase activity